MERINGEGILRSDKCLYCLKVVKPISFISHMTLKHRKETLSNHPEIVHQFQVPCLDWDELFWCDRLDLDKHAKEIHGNAMVFELKLGGVGPIDNRPSTDELHHFFFI